MIDINPTLYTTSLPSTVSGSTTQDDVDWYSLFNGGQVTDDYGNSERLKGRLSAAMPRIGIDNRISPTSFVANVAGDRAINLSNPSESEYWQCPRAQSSIINFSIDSPGAVDYIGIAGHTLGSSRIPYTIQSRFGAGSWFTVVPLTTPTNDRPIMHQFVPRSGHNYRILTSASALPGPEFRITTIYAGRALILPRSIYVGHTPITMGRQTTVSTNKSEMGNFLGRTIRNTYLSAKFSQKNIGPIFYRRFIDSFSLAAREHPFFFAWYPSKYPDEIAFCWSKNDINPSNASSNGDVEFDVTLGGKFE